MVSPVKGLGCQDPEEEALAAKILTKTSLMKGKLHNLWALVGLDCLRDQAAKIFKEKQLKDTGFAQIRALVPHFDETYQALLPSR